MSILFVALNDQEKIEKNVLGGKGQLTTTEKERDWNNKHKANTYSVYDKHVKFLTNVALVTTLKLALICLLVISLRFIKPQPTTFRDCLVIFCAPGHTTLHSEINRKTIKTVNRNNII